MKQIEQVQAVLHEIGASDIPQILVFNKLDMLDESLTPLRLHDTYEWDGKSFTRIFLSAQKGDGLAVLRQALAATVLAAKNSGIVLDEASKLENDDL